jgi:hypothetical protein
VASLFQGQETVPSLRFDHLESQSIDVSVEAFIDTWRKSALSKQVEHALSAENSDDDEGTESIKSFDRRALQASNVAATLLRTRNRVALGSADDSLPTPVESHPASQSVLNEENTTQSRSSPSNALPIEALAELESVPLPSDTGADVGRENTSSHINERLPTPLPADWRSLLDLYFSTTHCWLPICQKHELLRTAYVLASGASTEGPGGTGVLVSHGERACLMAILSYASFQRSSTNTRFMNTEDHVWAEQATASCSATKALLPENLQSYEIGHVRALLIITLIYIACGNRRQAWTSIGHTIYHITVLVKPPFRHERPWSELDEGIKRTLMCCISLDSLVAAWNGLRPYFTRSDIVNIGPLLTDGLEEWEPWKSHEPSNTSAIESHAPGRSLSTFNQFVNLVGILNDMLRSSNGYLTNNYSHLSRETVSDWSQRTPSLSDGFEPSRNPQQFNCYLLTRSVQELLRRHSEHRRSSETYPDTNNCLHQIDTLLRDFTMVTGRSFVPPICSISLFLLRLSVDHSSQPRTGFDTELQGLRDHLYTQNLLQSNISLDVHKPRPELPPGHEHHVSQAASHSESRPQRLEQADLPGARAGFPAGRLDSQPPSGYPNLGSIYPAAVGTAIGEPSSAFIMPNTTPSSMSVALSDDSLFQSLADLDSTDW